MAIILVPMVTSDADDAPEIDDVADAFKDNKDQSGDVMNFTTAKTLKVYEQRMMGIFEDMYNYGYIWGTANFNVIIISTRNNSNKDYSAYYELFLFT